MTSRLLAYGAERLQIAHRSAGGPRVQAGALGRAAGIHVHHLKAVFLHPEKTLSGIFEAEAQIGTVRVVEVFGMKITIECGDTLRRFAKLALVRDFAAHRRITRA